MGEAAGGMGGCWPKGMKGDAVAGSPPSPAPTPPRLEQPWHRVRVRSEQQLPHRRRHRSAPRVRLEHRVASLQGGGGRGSGAHRAACATPRAFAADSLGPAAACPAPAAEHGVSSRAGGSTRAA
jgi:hypothetical protein